MPALTGVESFELKNPSIRLRNIAATIYAFDIPSNMRTPINIHRLAVAFAWTSIHFSGVAHAAAQSTPFDQFPEGEPWTIHEVIRGDATTFYAPDGIVDVDKDGILDFMAWQGPSSPNNAASFHHGGDLRPLFRADNLYRSPPKRLGSGGVLKTPTGFRAYSFTLIPAIPQFRCLVFEGTPPQLIATVPPPSATLNSPNGFAWSFNYPAGDINNDGYDDLFAKLEAPFGWTSVALIDGATLATKWVNEYHMDATSPPIINRWPDPHQDIDGDGVKDIIVSFQSGTQGGTWHTRCLSGATGQEIWTDIRTSGQTPSFSRDPGVIGDVNSDGIRDIFFMKDTIANAWTTDPGFWRVLSGLDGTLIWEVPLAPYNPGALANPPWTGFGHKRTCLPTGDLDGDGVLDIMVYVDELSLPSMSDVEQRMWTISGSTGTLLLREKISDASRKPWSDAPFTEASLSRTLGDVDGDGWTEYHGFHTDANTAFSYDMAIFGRRTLTYPDTAQIGGVVDLGINIPTGANKPFQIAFSTGFDGLDGGHMVRDLWNSHLVDTPMLRSTALSPLLHGTLDSQGKAQIQMTIPPRAGLTGQTLYGVAFIEDPLRPKGILTKSSYATIEIVP